MRAGKLRHRITIQRRTQTPDGFGGPVDTWTDFAVSVPASVETLSGRELVAAQAQHAEATVQFGMRYLAGVDTTMRIVYAGLNHDIVSVIDVGERRRELQVLTKRGLCEG